MKPKPVIDRVYLCIAWLLSQGEMYCTIHFSLALEPTHTRSAAAIAKFFGLLIVKKGFYRAKKLEKLIFLVLKS